MNADERAYQLHRIGWIRCLCSMFLKEHDWVEDVDPDATWEMIGECRALAGELEDRLPAADPPPSMPASRVDDKEIPF